MSVPLSSLSEWVYVSVIDESTRFTESRIPCHLKVGITLLD